MSTDQSSAFVPEFWADQFLKAHNDDTSYPLISAAGTPCTRDEAYLVQRKFVAGMNRGIKGYKAALTALPAQAAMGIDTAIVGVLFTDGEYPQGQLEIHRPILLETELGFTTQTSISQATTADSVLDHFSQVSPLVELASPNLAGKPTGLDLVATNSASFGYIVADASELNPAMIDDLDLSLVRDGEQLLHGHSAEILSGQAAALSWLVNTVLEIGYDILPGQLFITGSIGGMTPGAPGSYRADYGSLGTIEFSL